MNTATQFKPSRKYVESLSEGDFALNPYGRPAKVLKITYRGDDIKGKAYVGVELENGENSTITHSFKEGELVRTLDLTRFYNSAECHKLEDGLPEQDELEVLA